MGRDENTTSLGDRIAGDLRHALVNAYAFGGNNISLILDKADVR